MNNVGKMAYNVEGTIVKDTVGASIVRVITESLYDKPIVVFREYVQNSVDSFLGIEGGEISDLAVNIWIQDDNLFFLDNGKGIAKEEFFGKMRSIGRSGKSKIGNLGYKGIGRLSGMAYCQTLSFINILDYQHKVYAKYQIDVEKYKSIQKEPNFGQTSIDELMDRIGILDENYSSTELNGILSAHDSMFKQRNSGFLVVLKGISKVLQNAISAKDFTNQLRWLLPVPFEGELAAKDPIKSLSNEPFFDSIDIVPARAFPIFFESKQLTRPLDQNMLRSERLYLCEFDRYAVCMHSFSNRKIEMKKDNPFSGIRIYIDNVLLCDEEELIPVLQQYGYLSHSTYETIQSVRGIGAMIFIVDKINISANARRTFIDITDQDAIDFLELLGSFVERIYQTRYALSNYRNAREKNDKDSEKLERLKIRAQEALNELAQQKIEVAEPEEKPKEFSALSKTEQKRIVKARISKRLNEMLNQYLLQTNEFDPDTCFDDFATWFRSKND